MGGRGEPRNLDDFAAVSRRISRIGPRNLAEFFAENCAFYILDGLVIVDPWIVFASTASRLGLYATGSRALSGDQIDSVDMSQLEKLINHISVFYRVSPRHKHTIVKVCVWMNGWISETQTHTQHYTVTQNKRHPFYICYNLVRCHPVLPILGRNIL